MSGRDGNQALHGFSVLQATESWAGPGNEATRDGNHSQVVQMSSKQHSPSLLSLIAPMAEPGSAKSSLFFHVRAKIMNTLSKDQSKNTILLPTCTTVVCWVA